MKILYVAKHGSGGNDDEGAITHALRVLGHEVDCVHEDYDRRPTGVNPFARPRDLVLFHKWNDFDQLRALSGPKCFWYFDLVECDDPSLRRRCRQRVEWMSRTIP